VNRHGKVTHFNTGVSLPAKTNSYRIACAVLLFSDRKYLRNKHNQLNAHFTFTTFYRCSMSRHVSGITCPTAFSDSLTSNQCNLTEHTIYIQYDRNLLSISAHNNHQFCVRVVPPEGGQVMPETCRDIEHQSSVVKVKCASSWLCYYVITSL
jgi:hypothetical protein